MWKKKELVRWLQNDCKAWTRESYNIIKQTEGILRILLYPPIVFNEILFQ